MLFKFEKFTIYFGDSGDPFFPGKYKKQVSLFKVLFKEVGAYAGVVLKQVHGTEIVCIEKLDRSELFCRHGDALVTSAPGIALGILTADCLPIVFVDSEKNICSVVHAGWKGSLAGISQRVVDEMSSRFGCQPKTLKIFFGPCARSCCYQVSPDFEELGKHCELSEIFKKSLAKRKDGLFFDNFKFNRRLLLQCGIKEKNMFDFCCHCTICNDNFHSHRRDGTAAGRQATLVCFNDF